MCPVVGRVEDLNKGSMVALDFLQVAGLLKVGVGQPELDFELGFNGLITNDKFCLTRWGHLILKADQRKRR
jgi:hypothetical protein